MRWKVAQAKQNLSKLIRAAAEEPQVIYKRDHRVAVVIGAETFEEFESWQRQREEQRSLADRFAELRQLCIEEDFELPMPSRQDRPNPFVETIEDP